MLKKVVKSTITKISSQDAPAKIICGIAFFVPYFFSIRPTILGTTTAGDTAPSTAPITAASTLLTPKIIGANTIYPTISKDAGTNAIITAERPAFLRSARSNDSPAFNKIMIKAILRRSAEIPKIDGSNRFKTYGPNTIPVTSIPMILGSFNFWQMAPIASPTRKINANDVNISTTFFLKIQFTRSVSLSSM